MSILEELWYGNIEPAEYDISPDKKYKEMLQLISRNEDKLLSTMTDAQKELFTKYSLEHFYYQSLTEPYRKKQLEEWCFLNAYILP